MRDNDFYRCFYQWVGKRQPGLLDQFEHHHCRVLARRAQYGAAPLDPSRGWRILIAITTCHNLCYGEDPGLPHWNRDHHNGPNERVAALRDTWLRDVVQYKDHIEYRLFYGEPHPRAPLADEVFLTCGDRYADLPAKSIAICQYAYEQGYDFLFRCDDDTGVYVGRLYDEIVNLADQEDHDLAGHRWGRSVSGGSGYILSRRALKIIVDNPVVLHRAEDWSIALNLGRAHIAPVNLPGHQRSRSSWFYDQGFDPGRDMRDVVTFNAVTPADLRAWYGHKGKD